MNQRVLQTGRGLLVGFMAVGCSAQPGVGDSTDGDARSAQVTQRLSSSGNFPNQAYAAEGLWQLISPQMGNTHHNQPSAFNGYLLLAGNAQHELWNVEDPTAPSKLIGFDSPFHSGEAESHQVSYARYANGEYYLATISGKGIDIWNVTNTASPTLMKALELEGINYGDNTGAVWGIAYQGRYIYVGGTNTGLHVVDAVDPENPVVVKRIPTTDFGGVSAGPVFAMGNVLTVTTPKESAGIATFDISNPADPILLDYEIPTEKSYIGGFYGKYAFLISPLRIYDVLTDPTDITSVSSTPTEGSEYVSFGDDFLFLGALRPNPGVVKIDLTDPLLPEVIGKVDGRDIEGVDDQFSLSIGNLLVLSDDQNTSGSVIGVHSTDPDTMPPHVIAVEPKDQATSQAVTSRVGISFSDQLDLAAVDPANIVVRPVGGEPLAGSLGLTHTVLSFAPSEALEPNTTYEVVVPAGGVHDLVGNETTAEFKSSFSTGENIETPPDTSGGSGGTGTGGTAAALSGGTTGAGATGGTIGTSAAGSGGTSSSVATPSTPTTANNTDGDGANDAACGCRTVGAESTGSRHGFGLALALAAGLFRLGSRRRGSRTSSVGPHGAR